jgi:hypothetical protein
LTASPDPSLYPATYRISFWKGFRILLVPIGLLALSQVGRAAHLGAFNLWFLAVILVIVTVSLGSFVFARVTLYPDRIERQSWFGKRTMRRAEVAGLVVRGSFKTPALTSKIQGEYPFPLPKIVKTDAAWDAWMTVIADAGPATGL